MHGAKERRIAALHAMQEPGCTGPLGCWIVAYTLRNCGIPGKLAFADLGRECLDFEAFWRDVALLVKQPDRLVSCFAQIEDIETAVLLLPEKERPAAARALAAMRAAEDPAAKSHAVRSLLEACWTPYIEPLLRRELENISREEP